jgi:phage shock protein C
MDPFDPKQPERSDVFTPGRIQPMALRRSRNDKMIAGVCGGIAKAAGWDPTTVRVVYVLASIFSAAFPGVVTYICLWIVMPKEPRGTL